MNKPDDSLEPLPTEAIRVECIEDPNSPLLASYQALMEKTFPPEELDSCEITEAALEANKDPDTRNKLIILSNVDSENAVLGTLNASYLSAQDQGIPLGWSMVNINYVALDERYRGRGIASALYPALSAKCSQIAENAGEKIKYVVGETVETVEAFVNRSGRHRLYFEKNGAWEELAYEQAPLEWDLTGNAESEAVPLHLMATPTDGSKLIPVQDLLKIVDSIYEENSRENARLSCSPDGYSHACTAVETVLNKLKEQVQGIEVVRLISKAERERMQSEGTVFIEHKGV